jgi:hypothetical protein
MLFTVLIFLPDCIVAMRIGHVDKVDDLAKQAHSCSVALIPNVLSGQREKQWIIKVDQLQPID